MVFSFNTMGSKLVICKMALIYQRESYDIMSHDSSGREMLFTT